MTDNKALNEYMPDDSRRIPFRNMIYIGDGLTDVPCMKIVKVNGGHSITVYQKNKQTAEKMLRQGRVDYMVPADYSKGSKMENLVFAVLDQITSTSKTIEMHLEDFENLDSNF